MISEEVNQKKTRADDRPNDPNNLQMAKTNHHKKILPSNRQHLFTMPSSTTFRRKLRAGLKENPQGKRGGRRRTNRGDNVPEQNRQKEEEEDDEILLDWVPYPSEATRARVLQKQQATARQTRKNPAGDDHPGSPWIANGSGNVTAKMRVLLRRAAT